MKNSIDIIGGGVGGLAMGLSLQNYDIPFTLYEKADSITYHKVGLGISANIFSILKEWGVYEQIRGIGTEIRKLTFADSKLKPIKQFVVDSGPLCVDRQKFHKLLAAELPAGSVRLSTEKRPKDIKPEVISVVADGCHSAVRQAVFPEIKIRNSDQLLFRGICQLSPVKEFSNNYYDLLGHGLRFAIIPTGGNVFSWYAIAPLAELSDFTDSKSILKDLFATYHPWVLECIEETQEIYSVQLCDIDPHSRRHSPWHYENCVFIGDAIHATTPNLANGACLAMEDAWVLASMLAGENSSLIKVFNAFRKARINKVNSVVDISWNLGKLLHQKNALWDLGLRYALKVTPQFVFNNLYSRQVNR